MIKGRSIQTHGQEFAELCGEVLCTRARHKQQTTMQSDCNSVEAPTADTGRKNASHEDEDKSDFERRPQTWNAYQHEQAMVALNSDQPTPTKPEMSASYKAGANVDDLSSRCNLAELARQHPDHVGSSFGQKRKAVTDALRRRAAMPLPINRLPWRVTLTRG